MVPVVLVPDVPVLVVPVLDVPVLDVPVAVLPVDPVPVEVEDVPVLVPVLLVPDVPELPEVVALCCKLRLVADVMSISAPRFNITPTNCVAVVFVPNTSDNETVTVQSEFTL